jgi:hypothetical protein
MGESSAATVREIEDIRDRLETNVQELERRMPAPAIWGKRLAGIAIGGGVGALVLRQVLKRKAKKRSPVEKVKRAVSESSPAQAVIQVVPEEVAGKVSKALEDGRWKQWAAAGAGVWLAFRLVELRQLRKLNKAVIAGRV